MKNDQDMLNEFILESREHLETIEDDFLNLERHKDNPDPQLVNKIFRAIHTVKGCAGFLGKTNIKKLAHVMETLLSMIREGEIKPESKFVDPILEGVDVLNTMLDNLENSAEIDTTEIYNKLSNLLPGELPAVVNDEFDMPADNFESHEVDPCDIIEANSESPENRIIQEKQEEPFHEEEVTNIKTQQTAPLEPVIDEKQYTTRDSQQLEIPRPSTLQPDSVLSLPKSLTSGERSNSIRINVGILDQLMMLAGELVLVRNQQLLHVDKSNPLSRSIAQRLDIVTSELQESIMRTRMQPIGNVFGKFNRIVRDLGNKLNKQIQIEITGNEVELDKTILESLSDPLTHLIRNCCDHGIELPNDREKVGKSAIGHLSLKAYHEGGQINIEIIDDGKGINIDAIKKKVLEKNLKTEGELALMKEKDVQLLILLPGFSTVDQISDVSGRGVGMDVVKSNIEELGGIIDIESKFGKGTKMHLRLPLTLAIIPCLIVMVGKHRYAVPQVNLEELVCLYDDDIRTKIEYAGNKEVYRLRDTLLPMVRLVEVLKRPSLFTDETKAEINEMYRKQEKNIKEFAQVGDSTVVINNDSDPQLIDNGNLELTTRNSEISQSLNFAVLRVGANRFGLIVDQVLGTEEIVVKPMHPALKSLGCYSGATVMGDGKVALILDVDGIARHANVDLNVRSDDAANSEQIEKNDKTESILIFRNGAKEQFAVVLPLIKRIEHINTSNIERVAEKMFITIDDVSTLILQLDHYIQVSPCIEKEEMYLLIPKHAEKPFGILISTILDIEELTVNITSESYMEDGLLGTAIVNDHITLFIDIFRLIEIAEPSWFVECHNT